MITNNLYWELRDPSQRARLAIVKRRDFLIRNHPNVVEEYKGGASLADLARKYLLDDYQISPNVAKNAVLYTIEKLLDPNEKAEVGLEHKRQAHKKRKDLNQIKKGKNPEKVAAGKKSYSIGLSKLSSEELARVCINTMSKRGIFPYEGEVRFVNTSLNGQQLLYPMNEKEYILYLREQREMTWYVIEDEVNREFAREGRNPRKANSIRVVYQTWKRKNGSN